MRFVPAAADASEKIWIEGPGPARGANHCWMIDGRDKEVPSGTIYKLSFRWGKKRSQVKWIPVDPASLDEDTTLTRYTHKYYVFGSVTGYSSFLELQPSGTESGVWNGIIRIGHRGEEMFCFVRDCDVKQSIYPEKTSTMDASMSVRGPDNLGVGKYWKVIGAVDEDVSLQLKIQDAHVEVSIAPAKGNEITWRSKEGWARHDYYVRASWSEEIIPLTMNLDTPGIFTCTGHILGSWSEDFEAFVERFQILIDGDTSQCLYPMAADADSGKYITCGPTGSTSEYCWTVRALSPGEEFQVVLDLTTDDRRKRVTWKWGDMQSSLDDRLACFEKQLQLQLSLSDASA
jgi:hypothetical protein